MDSAGGAEAPKAPPLNPPLYRIVLVGGDGSYHQAVNGLMRRLLKEAGLDENDSTTNLPCVPIPIGMIPAGLIVAV